MRDWMISKKRYWGLALPIWECEGCAAFDVVGGRDELRERAVAGWEQLEGHTPHRPHVDAVRLRCGACGGRTEVVGRFEQHDAIEARQPGRLRADRQRGNSGGRPHNARHHGITEREARLRRSSR